MINQKLPHEVFEQCEKIRYKKDRQEYLEKHGNTFSVRTVLQLNFDDNIKLDLPEGKPPYKEDDAPTGMQLQSIDKALKMLGYLVPDSGYDKVKKEVMFIQMLESITKQDAAIIVAAKDSKLQDLYSKITINLVQDSFPKLFPVNE
mgnify:CR=1 FL=1|tara:strand:- start:3448 stop:3885 length:438 start_codon:yes stop_codon:yes gene_type:complete